MPSCSNVQSTNVGCAKVRSMLHSTDSHERILKTEEAQDQEEEEEGDEEDADFNPFVKETPSQEASSSLSSEVDGVDGDLVDNSLPVDMNISKLTTKEHICAVEDCEHGEEEIAVHSSLSEDGTCEQELQKNATCSSKKRRSALNSESETNQEKDNGCSKTDDYASKIGELNNATKPQSLVVETEDNDAICTRTRARYSLASFTLDELETFLQESDGDDDLQNVDDEEEYKKFLAAVLQGGDDEGLSPHENEHVDDEDEDNDADFEIELEELLESDNEENAAEKTQKEYEGATRRPETRQNWHQKASSQCEKKTLGLAKKPLRPILPNLPNGPPASGKLLMPDATLSFQSSASGNGHVNGFTPQQIGQLHTLIHEHVQLLIQVFSLSVFDPSRQQIASQVQDLLFELLHKRDKVASSKSVPYPSICFYPSNVFSSVSNGGQYDVESCAYDAQRMFLSQSNQCSSEGRCGYNSSRSNPSQDIEGSLQSYFVRGPIISILDVAPLNFVGRFVDDVHSAIQECRNRYLKSGCDMHAEKEPLFPCYPSLSNATNEVSNGTSSAAGNVVSTSSGQQQPKKTLAAMLVESTMKQSVASVPKEIAELTQRFLPTFNPVLFPHKPPPPAVVNRVLFTDSEDELLALGLLEYNTDWKAIQQRFLPCKSKHQIFVRQKNRCSSKAPDNPIKAVRRMKTSPLTADEIARIHEGLKVHKFDWISIWQYLVPHRDPSLLPRQWRIALGTQKSYKLDAAKKEKRRLYESKRRKLKAATLESWQAVSDKEGCEDEIAGTENWMDDSDVAYVHQAFLADWRPETSIATCLEHSPANDREGNLVNDAMSQEASQTYNSRQTQTSVCGKAEPKIGDRDTFPFVSRLPQFHISSDVRSSLHGVSSAMKPRDPVFDTTTSGTKYHYRPYRYRKVNSSHLVKLAPDLPPVNLPPSVRVVSQTAFKGYHCGTSKTYPSGEGVSSHRKDHYSPVSAPEKCGSVHPVMSTSLTAKDNGTAPQPDRSGTVGGRSFAEKGASSDVEMHPLLFQAAENMPYYPLKLNSGISSSFSFFSGAQPQLNLSLFHRPHQQNHAGVSHKSSKSKGCTSRSGGFDFHPLLQKSNDLQLQTSFDAIQTESPFTSCMAAVDTSSSINEKSNELDLDIHLSHASGNEKSIAIRHSEANDPMGCTINVTNCGTAAKPLETGVPCSLEGEKSPTVSSSRPVSSVHPQLLVSPNDIISRCDIDDLGDNSHPEIVMEQEELSDSEEDIEEHVEFECEEMADSEGENSAGCEQLIGAHDKEIPHCAVEKITTENFLMGNSSELRSNSNTQAEDSPIRDDICASKMAVSSEGKGDKSNTAWLSLDSSSADNAVLSKTMHEVGRIGETAQELVRASEAPSSQNVDVSLTGNKADAEDLDTVDIVQQLQLGPVVFATPKKPRKHSGKARSSLNIGLSVER